MNGTGVLQKTSEWSCSETPQESALIKSQLPCSQPHNEHPRTPEAVPISVSLPKHPVSRIPGSKYSLGQQVYLFWVLPWSATLCPYSFPSATSHTHSLDIFLIAHYTFSGFYLPKSESLSLTSGPAAFFGKKKTHISYFPVFLLLTHLFSFLQIKDILVFQSKASESYEQNNLFSPSIFLRKAWNILMQRFSWRQKLAWKNSSQTARVWLSYK